MACFPNSIIIVNDGQIFVLPYITCVIFFAPKRFVVPPDVPKRDGLPVDSFSLSFVDVMKGLGVLF